jgi:hypothetical protein
MSDYWDFSPEAPESDQTEDSEDSEKQLWEFQTAMDERVCPICAPLDGGLYTELDLDIYFPNSVLLGDLVLARLHRNCRCSLTKVEGDGEATED